MYLTNHLRKYFNHTLQSRSYKYQRKAKFGTATRDFIGAVVRGTRRFQVNLARHDDQILAECDCPVFEASGVCEHLWAVIAQARGNFASRSNRRPKEMIMTCAGISSAMASGWRSPNRFCLPTRASFSRANAQCGVTMATLSPG